MSSSTPTPTSLTTRPPSASSPAATAAAGAAGPIRRNTHLEKRTSDATPDARSGPYPSTWLLRSRDRLDAAFDRAWAAYTAEYNREFKTRTSTEEIRGRVMAGHNIHGEDDVLLPRPTVEHRLTRRRRK